MKYPREKLLKLQNINKFVCPKTIFPNFKPKNKHSMMYSTVLAARLE